MQKRLKATVAFYRDLEPDPDAAAVALRQAGYEVAMIPEKIAHGWPPINLMEVTKCIDEVNQLVEMMDDVQAIVHPLRRHVPRPRADCGDHVPFSGTFWWAVAEQGEQERIDVRVTPWLERPATPDEVEMVERLLQRAAAGEEPKPSRLLRGQTEEVTTQCANSTTNRRMSRSHSIMPAA